MKNFFIFLLLSVCIFIFYKYLTIDNSTIDVISNEENNSSTNTPSNEEENSTINKYYNLYTGEECSEDDNNKASFMAMVENSSLARPQSGLSYADIIYETSAEGGIPRFIALFHSNLPNMIGPIRSVRPYFIDIAKEFNLPFAHCGGSEDALNIISSDKTLNSINEISKGSYFWRDNSRSAPHNLYTSSENITKYLTDNNITITNSQFCTFDENYYNNSSLKDAANINIKVNSIYSTDYSYENGSYIKSMDSEKAIDALNNQPLSFTNVVIQKTDINLGSDNSHLDIRLLGEGDGYIFSKGKMIDIKWRKDSETSKTKLYDLTGNEVPLSPGKTIWNIISNSSTINIS